MTFSTGIVMDTIVQITLKDGLMFPSGFTALAAYSCIIFCRVPPEWLDGDKLEATKLEAVFEKLYGENWRAGNVDGSRYVVQNVESRVLTPAEEQTSSWRAASNNREYHYWFYHVSAAGELQEAGAQSF